MAHIRQLSAHVADLIAAGEVVERPASVVKELVENAIDAGAKAVTVELQNGGMTYLRVSDDGCGIAPSELPTAFLRHATSKLRAEEDLAAIGTLGFRGEALAAIAAVSRLDIFSREHGAESGARLHLEGGTAEEVVPAGCPEGTSVIVRDLFYNTPARLKFMRRDSAEASAIAGLVAHLALSHPEVSFKLLRDGEQLLLTPGDGTLRAAVYAAQGREFARSLVEVKGSDAELSVQGFVTAPSASRGTRAMQSFFVNGRLIKSQLLTAALEESYKNRMMKGKFPGCVLLLTLPCDMVDVNVHPAKTIVKFVAEKRVFDLVYHAATAALDRAEQPQQSAQRAAQQNAQGEFFVTMRAEDYRAPEKQHAPSARQEQSTPQETAWRTRIPAVQTELGGRMELHDFVRREVPRPMPVQSAPIVRQEPQAAPVQQNAPKEEPPREAEQLTLTAESAPWRIAGEVLNTYIVCEDEEKNVWLIDKHAAHERVNFDRLRARQEPAMSQTLLAPLVAELDAESAAALSANLALLREFGFECEDFGGGSLLVRAVPAEINGGDAVAALEEIAGKFVTARTADPAAARDALLHTIACKAAIKGGWQSDERELRALVEKVQSGEVQFCPHGRPVKVKLSKYELEKMFKRA